MCDLLMVEMNIELWRTKFLLQADQIWDWEGLTSPPRMFIFLWIVYCKDLIPVLLSILYSPLLYHHLQPFWVEMFTDKNCVCFNSIFSFWERQDGHIRELELGEILSTELFIGLSHLKMDPLWPGVWESCTSPIFWPVGIWTF